MLAWCQLACGCRHAECRIRHLSLPKAAMPAIDDMDKNSQRRALDTFN